ncbi:hypothetical protein MKZ38_007461 [Zalerion maritima]|uniref:Ureidoglycolate hydrolase n=1 Tax=Zalerion maritima TaxID=339359 RepID=A0AAD5RIS4_9PEZI|nr:hypothetical protein MKZ38_007461 [Zalerion maritima]
MVSNVAPCVKNKIENLSGIALKEGGNPYQALIEACEDDHHRIQLIYLAHREARNDQQREKFLSKDCDGVIIDPVLLRLENPTIEPGFRDDRHCLTFWARPPDHVLKLASYVQTLLKEAAPNLWLMPPHCMHMTALEVAHSKTPSEITRLVKYVKGVLPVVTTMTVTPGKRPRLVKPLLSYDLAAVALSFVPAVDEPTASPAAVPETTEEYNSRTADATLQRQPGEDGYTYHHFRRDLFDLLSTTGAEITSRYVVPSAHITLGRFLTQGDHSRPSQRTAWINKIEEVNRWLQSDVWGQVGADFVGEWCIGQEKGLESRAGSLWYGGGRAIMVGEGF